MGEGTTAVDIAQRVYAWHVGFELVVDGDEPARIGNDSGARQAEIVGIRCASGGDQQMCALNFWCAVVARDTQPDSAAMRLNGKASRSRAHGNTFALQDGAHFV